MFEQIRKKAPVVHCITNYVTANEVANMILAVGGVPVMADFFGEVQWITEKSDALVLNMGTLNEERAEVMLYTGKIAANRSKPIILDPVGIGISPFRMEKLRQILKQVKVSVICGNRSEIQALVGGNSDNIEKDVKNLSKRTGSIIVMTGQPDFITDGDRVAYVKNGHPFMTRITGTGCMLNGVLAAFTAVGGADCFGDVVNACAAYGMCGEQAYQKIRVSGGGTGSFQSYFLDTMSQMDDQILTGGIHVDIICHNKSRSD